MSLWYKLLTCLALGYANGSLIVWCQTSTKSLTL
jgi:hypothetical protein